jgi:hypothetical protein
MLFSGMLYLQTANCTSCWAGAKARKKLGFDGPVGARPRDKLRIFIFFIPPSILQKYMVHKFFLQNHTFSAVEDAVPPAAQNQISNRSDRLDFILFYSTKFFPT